VEVTQRNAIRDGLKSSLERLTEREGEFIKSMETLILGQLLITGDPLVLDITDGLPRAWDVDFARVHNGDIEVAIRHIAAVIPRRWLAPGSIDRQLEAAVAGCHRYYDVDNDRRRDFIERMQVILEDDPRSAAVAALLGYLAWPEFAPLLAKSWQRKRHLWDPGTELKLGFEGYMIWLHHLWALGRCCTTETKQALAELLYDVEGIDDTPDKYGASKRFDRFRQQIGRGFGLRHPVTSAAAEVWVQVATERDSIAQDLFNACRHLEHPVVVEAYVRWAAVSKSHLWDNFSRSIDVLTDTQPILSDRFHGVTVYQNPAVLNRLWDIVRDDPGQEVRALAFDIWKRSAGTGELQLLQGIAEGDPLFDAALAVRVRLADTTAHELLTRKITEEPGDWCGYAPRLYDHPDVRRAFLDNFAAAVANNFEVCYAPRHIPPQFIPEFVTEHRAVLLKKSHSWIPLLLTDVADALTLVRDAIKQASARDMELLFFGNFHSGRPLTRRMLEALEPVLDRLDERDIPHFIEQALRDGHADWITEHMPHHAFKDEHRSMWLTEQDILCGLNTLAELVPNGVSEVHFTSEYHDVVNRESHHPIFKDRVAIMKEWTGDVPTYAKIVIAGLVMSEQGTSDDLDWWKRLPTQDNLSGSVHHAVTRLLKIRRWQT
jgi:hypothetical protein